MPVCLIKSEYKSLMQSGADESELPDFDTYISNWLNNVKINELKPLSFDRLESTINNHIIPSIGHYQTGKITDSAYSGVSGRRNRNYPDTKPEHPDTLSIGSILF